MSLSISAVGGYDTLYPVYNAVPVNPVSQAGQVTRGSEGTYRARALRRCCYGA